MLPSLSTFPCTQQIPQSPLHTHSKKSASICSTALTIAGLILGGLSIVQLILATPLTLASSIITVVALAVTALLCLVAACVIRCKAPKKELVKPEVHEIKIQPQTQAPVAKAKYLKPGLNLRQAYNEGVFKTPTNVPFTVGFSLEMTEKFSRALRSLNEVLIRVIRHEDIAPQEEIGPLFLSKMHQPKTSSLSNLIFNAQEVLSAPLSGSAWLCHSFVNPAGFRDFAKCLSSLTKLLTSTSSIQSKSPSREVVAMGTLLNCFLCGWALPTQEAALEVLSSLSLLPVSQDKKEDILKELDAGNILGALLLAYRYQNVQVKEIEELDFLEDPYTLWSPAERRKEAPLPVDDSCLARVRDSVHAFASTCPTSLDNFLELRTQLKDIYAGHSNFITSCPGALSATIATLVALHDEPVLQEKLRLALPVELVESVERTLSFVLLGSLTTGIMTEEHLALIGEALGCGSEVAEVMVKNKSAVTILLEKMLWH